MRIPILFGMPSAKKTNAVPGGTLRRPPQALYRLQPEHGIGMPDLFAFVIIDVMRKRLA
ncbi:hypothetical protein CM49_04094 [Paenibacillus sp. P1XP2]|nr:hypothetical protein CM49_04094 [Paenibacillus sp. P1XP2]